MAKNKFDWSQVPSTEDGFVDYSRIKSHQIRLMLMDAEKLKLSEELQARRQWELTNINLQRIKKIEQRLLRLR